MKKNKNVKENVLKNYTKDKKDRELEKSRENRGSLRRREKKKKRECN